MPWQPQTSSAILLAIASSRLPFSLSYFCSPSASLCPRTLVGGSPGPLSGLSVFKSWEAGVSSLSIFSPRRFSSSFYKWIPHHFRGWIAMPVGERTCSLTTVTGSSLISQGQNVVGLQIYITKEDLQLPPPPRKTKSRRWPGVFTFRNEKVDFISALEKPCYTH